MDMITNSITDMMMNIAMKCPNGSKDLEGIKLILPKIPYEIVMEHFAMQIYEGSLIEDKEFVNLISHDIKIRIEKLKD